MGRHFAIIHTTTTVGHDQENVGQTTGKGAYNEKDAWWWKEVVHKAVTERRLKFKQYQQSRCDEDKDESREANKRAKRGVTKAKGSAYKDLYEKLDLIEG